MAACHAGPTDKKHRVKRAHAPLTCSSLESPSPIQGMAPPASMVGLPTSINPIKMMSGGWSPRRPVDNGFYHVSPLRHLVLPMPHKERREDQRGPWKVGTGQGNTKLRETP